MLDFPTSEIAILVPTVNEATLEQVISALSRSNVKMLRSKFWVLEVQLEIARKFNTGFIDFHKKTPKSIMLNSGCESSSKKYFIVIDADAVPIPTWFSEMVKLFDQNHKIFSGSVALDNGNFWMKVYNYSLLHEFSSTKPASFRNALSSNKPRICETIFH